MKKPTKKHVRSAVWLDPRWVDKLWSLRRDSRRSLKNLTEQALAKAYGPLPSK